jgi:DNA-binding IclR family transcriptional regulator
MRVFDALKDHPDGLKAASIAHRSGVPPTSIYRHLSTLEDLGWIYPSGEKYVLNPTAEIPLGSADHVRIDQILEEFTQITGRDVALATLNVKDLVLTHLHKPTEAESLLDGLAPDAAHATACGQALLAQLSDVERRRFLTRAGMRRFTDRTATTPQELEARLHHDADAIWTAEGEYCVEGACLAMLARSGPMYASCIAVTTSVFIADLEQSKALLATTLHRTVALLQPSLGPLLSAVVESP